MTTPPEGQIVEEVGERVVGVAVRVEVGLEVLGVEGQATGAAEALVVEE